MTHQIVFTLHTAVIGSEDLYRAVRAAFVGKGTSLSAWCRSNGINRQTAEKTLRGNRNGRRASDLRQRLVLEAFPIEAAE